MDNSYQPAPNQGPGPDNSDSLHAQTNGEDTVAKESASAPPPKPQQRADPFDPARLRLSQNFTATAGVKKPLTRVPVDKPNKESWFRINPNPEYRMEALVLELKSSHEKYIVVPELKETLAPETTISPRLLVTAITRGGTLFIWPMRVPGPDGRTDGWTRSAWQAAELAMTSWVRMTANMENGSYDVLQATASFCDPVWPEITFRDLLAIAFRDSVIDKIDHPALQRLRGEI
jgi:hypothetical protein